MLTHTKHEVPPPPKDMSERNCKLMRSWAAEHGKCVRQKTVRQTTTKYRAGILPLNRYEKDLFIGEKLNLDSNMIEGEDNDHDDLAMEQMEEEQDQFSEYDSGSDESDSEDSSALETGEDVGRCHELTHAFCFFPFC